jgi:hypothetical protein
LQVAETVHDLFTTKKHSKNRQIEIKGQETAMSHNDHYAYNYQYLQ